MRLATTRVYNDWTTTPTSTRSSRSCSTRMAAALVWWWLSSSSSLPRRRATGGSSIRLCSSFQHYYYYYNNHKPGPRRSRSSSTAGTFVLPRRCLAVGSSGSSSSRTSHLEESRESDILAATATAQSFSSQQPQAQFYSNHSSSSSPFLIHVLVEDSTPRTVVEVVERELDKLRRQQHVLRPGDESVDANEQQQQPPLLLSASQLIQLGSVWFLSAGSWFTAGGHHHDKVISPKPKRVPRNDFLVQRGDYLRIHHHPRRFPAVYDYDWRLVMHKNQPDNDKNVPAAAAAVDRDDDCSEPATTKTSTTVSWFETLQSPQQPPQPHHHRRAVVLDYNLTQGWLVLDKPPSVPVHMTVDNQLENVVACLQQSNHHHHTTTRNNDTTTNNNDPARVSLPYVGIPQRLDINTSGLLMVATTPAFASYASQLLRNKTHSQLKITSCKNKNTTTTTMESASMTSNATSINHGSTEQDHPQSQPPRTGGIHKIYRCLVCLMEPSASHLSTNYNNSNSHKNANSAATAATATARELQSMAATGRILRHYLEPSLRAPKRFVVQPPSNNNNDESCWPECLLKIRRASRVVYDTRSTAAGQRLAEALWGPPPQQQQQENNNNPVAVMELEIELLTGRTHQIRGQLSAYGCPVVGDVPYGGGGAAVASQQQQQERPGGEGRRKNKVDSDRLALQCCELEFLEPTRIDREHKMNRRNNSTTELQPSSRWKRFRLETAWWTPLLEQYEQEMRNGSDRDDRDGDDHHEEGAFTAFKNGHSSADRTDGNASYCDLTTTSSSSTTPVNQPARPEWLPPRVQLSSGRHKYVLLRATTTHDDDSNNNTTEWFVKSAAPHECGGPHHGHVAQDLREWIEAAGYTVDVMGGGRIDYRKAEGMAVVYGFSYAFGKGDHAKVAALITEWSEGTIEASYDNSEGLY